METNFDVIVAGSGDAGFAAATRALSLGMRVLIVEKEHQWGGTSASSGGGVWIPDHGIAANGDSREKALAYLTAVSSDGVRMERLEAFVDGGKQMVSFLQENGVRLHVLDGYPDYFPDAPGAISGEPCFPTRSMQWK